MTAFDALTVTCFIGLVGAYFRFTAQDIGTLLRFLLAAIVLAIANQVGDAGFVFLGVVLIIAAVGYACLDLIRR
jgi:hypothetical protein